jgi:hypothetical protein
MSISKRTIPLLALTLSLLGCAHGNSESYADAVLNRPMPPDDDARMRECAWIRSEIARQQGLAGVGATMATNPLMAAAYQAMAQRNVAALESRAANIQCTAAFSNAPAAAPVNGQSFDQCFARCQQYTDRSKDQCFDPCNK